jgi:hypothetical protein
MKKVNTVAVPQIRNFSQQKLTTEKLTIGLDLGDRSSWYCLLDEAGRVLLEQRVSATPKTIREVFRNAALPDRAGGMHSPWVSRILANQGTK